MKVRVWRFICRGIAEVGVKKPVKLTEREENLLRFTL
jgi:hypothetical protein